MSDTNLSKGHKIVFDTFKSLFPNYEVVTEFYVGERLHLDVYCPRFKVGAEYHGRQHFEFVNHFHQTKDDFLRGVKNDERKAELCKEQGITLVVFTHKDDLSVELISQRILESITTDEPVKKKTDNPSKKSDYYIKMKELQNARKREFYQRVKRERKNNGR